MIYKSLLVPVDLAEPELAQPAIDAAAGFAKAGDGRLRLITVLSLIPVTFMEFVPADFDSLQEERAKQALADLAAKTGLPADRVSTAVRLGDVYPEVLAEVDHWKADLVIVGSHRPAMSTYLLGSNATRIVRHALCSVLVVRTPPAT